MATAFLGKPLFSRLFAGSSMAGALLRAVRTKLAPPPPNLLARRAPALHIDAATLSSAAPPAPPSTELPAAALPTPPSVHLPVATVFGWLADRMPSISFFPMQSLFGHILWNRAPKKRTSYTKKRIRRAGQLAVKGPKLKEALYMCPVCERMKAPHRVCEREDCKPYFKHR
ncbi:MAG: hypothetical protein SGPRY_002072 [Prymnesium sp.]